METATGPFSCNDISSASSQFGSERIYTPRITSSIYSSLHSFLLIIISILMMIKVFPQN